MATPLEGIAQIVGLHDVPVKKTGGWCQTHPFPTSRWFMCHATIIITLLSLPVNNMFHNILFTNLRTPTETRTPFIGLKNQDPNP